MNVVFVVALFFRVVVVNEDDGCIERAFEFTISVCLLGKGEMKKQGERN